MADAAFTKIRKAMAGVAALGAGMMQPLHRPGDPAPFILDRALAEEALALIDRDGSAAWRVAASRADESRARGNIVQYCRLRQLERLIAALGDLPPQRH